MINKYFFDRSQKKARSELEIKFVYTTGYMSQLPDNKYVEQLGEWSVEQQYKKHGARENFTTACFYTKTNPLKCLAGNNTNKFKIYGDKLPLLEGIVVRFPPKVLEAKDSPTGEELYLPIIIIEDNKEILEFDYMVKQGKDQYTTHNFLAERTLYEVLTEVEANMDPVLLKEAREGCALE